MPGLTDWTPVHRDTDQAFQPSNAWLNLHHYVRAVARGGPAPTGLTGDEQKQWAAGVEFYKPYAARDVTFDDGMIAIKNALHGAEGRPASRASLSNRL